jgi:2-iminobutanoate/2-iminopropanoate deaminase
MKQTIISTPSAPAAVGPYSQAVKFGRMVYTAGQVAIDPATATMSTGDISEQTHRVLQNLRAVLTAAGTGLENVVKTTVFLQDMGDFAAMNAVYEQYFGSAKPARSTVAVAGLPLQAKVEIEAVAFLPSKKQREKAKEKTKKEKKEKKEKKKEKKEKRKKKK